MKWVLYVVVINLFALCSAEDVQILEFHIEPDTSGYGGGDLKCSGGPLDIELNKQYKIRVNYKSVRTVYTKARWGLEQNMSNIVMLKGKGDYAESYKFTAPVLGNFKYTGVFFTHVCEYIEHDICYYVYPNNIYYTDNGVTCQTTINVYRPGERIIKPEASLKVNTKTFSTSGLEPNYEYYDGEGTIFTCTKIVGSFIQLSFTTLASRFVSTGWQPSPSVSMYVKLTSSMSGTKLQCIVSDDKGQQLNITLHLTLLQQGLTAFRVNGLIPPLKSQSDRDGNLNYYEYIFRNDEKLTVEFIKDARFGPSSCSVDGPNIPYKLQEFFKIYRVGAVAKSLDGDPLTFPLSQGGSGTFLTCTVATTQSRAELFNYTIKFISHNPFYEPYFFDLSMSNILLNFWNNTGHQFEYEVDSTANTLFCVCCGKKNDPLILSDHHYSFTSDDNVRSVTKLTLEDQNEDKLECGSHNVRVVRKKTTTVSPSSTHGYYITTLSPFNTGQDNVQKPTKTVTGHKTGIPGNNNNQPDQNREHIQTQNPFITENQSEENQHAYAPRKISENEIANKYPKPQIPTYDNHGIPTTFKSSSRENDQFDPQISSTNFIYRENINTHPINPINPQLDEPQGRSYGMQTGTGRGSSRTGNFSKKQLQPSQVPTKVSDSPFSDTNRRSSTQTTTSSEIEDPSTTPPNLEIESNKAGKEKLNSAGTDGWSHWLLVFSLAVVILLLAAVLWLGYSYSRKRMLKQNSNVDYQNLPEHLEGPMATPSQWDNRPDDVTYSHPVVENLYTVPVTKGNRPFRHNIEPVYSQPRDSNITYENTGVRAMELTYEAGYAEVGQTGPTYASVGQNGPTYAEADITGPTYVEAGHVGPTCGQNGPTYAEAGLTGPTCAEAGPTGPTYASVQKASTLTNRPQDTYAEVQKKHERNATNQRKGASHYQNVDTSKPDESKRVLPQVNYANVQEIKPESCGYVNGDVRDVIEPAYSELSKKM